MLTCLTLQRRSIHRSSASSAPVTSQQRLATVCGLMQLQKGCLRAHRAEVRGTKFKAEVLYCQCVWSRPAFLWGEAEEESRTASGALQTGSARGNKLTLAMTMFWATHQHSASHIRQLRSLPMARWLSWTPENKVIKAPCSQDLCDSDQSPVHWNQWDSSTGLIHLPPTSIPYLLGPLISMKLELSGPGCPRGHGWAKRNGGNNAWTLQKLKPQERLCLPCTLSKLAEY